MDDPNLYFSYDVSISIKIEAPSDTHLTTDDHMDRCPYEIYINFAENRRTVVVPIGF